jgi:hypothetical protein
MVLRVNVDDERGISVEELLDETAEAAKDRMRLGDGKYVYPIAQGTQRERRPVEDLRVTARASYSDFEIVRYESGAIRIMRDGVVQPVVVKDILRPIAAEVRVDLLNPRGEAKNTQTLGADVIRALNLRSGNSRT